MNSKVDPYTFRGIDVDAHVDVNASLDYVGAAQDDVILDDEDLDLETAPPSPLLYEGIPSDYEPSDAEHEFYDSSDGSIGFEGAETMKGIYDSDDEDEDEGGDSGGGQRWKQGGDRHSDEPTVSPRRHLFVECLACLTVMTILAAVMIGNVLLVGGGSGGGGEHMAGDEGGTTEQVFAPPAPASSSVAAASPPSIGKRVGPSGGEFRSGFDLDQSQPPPPPPPPSDLAALCHVATLQTAGGRARCRDACEPAVLPCCLVKEGGLDCRKQVDEQICMRYGSCHSLSVFPPYGGLGVGDEDDRGDDATLDAATVVNHPSGYPHNESSTVDPSTSMTDNDDNLFTTEELVAELCSPDNFAEPEGRDDCAELCLPGRCCFILALNLSSSSSPSGRGDDNHEELGSTEKDCSSSHGSLCDTYAGCRDLYEKYGWAAGGVGNGSENSENNSHVDSSSAAVAGAAASGESAGVGAASENEGGDRSVDGNASPTDLQPQSTDSDGDDDGTNSTENGGEDDATTTPHDDLPPPQLNTTEACAAEKITDDDDDGTGIEGCRTACAEGACCFADVDGPFSCRSSDGGQMERWCVAYYGPCEVLKGLAGDGEGGPFGGGATSSPHLAVMGRLWSEASPAQQESAAAATAAAAGTTTTSTLEKANVALSRPPPDVGGSATASNGGGR